MKLNEKSKRLLRISWITVIVYVCFRYLLPLVTPFLLAAVTAVLLRPSACWASERLHFSWRGKERRLGPGIIGFLELVLLLAAAVGLICYGGRVLVRQIHLLADHLPIWIHQLDAGLTGACRRVEITFSMKEK